MEKFTAHIVIGIAVVISVAEYSLGTQTSKNTGCNPMVDILFVLDGSDYVNETEFSLQKTFINELLGQHQAPRGAVRAAMSVCAGSNVSSAPFTDSVTSLMRSFNQMSNIRQQNCLEDVNFKFKSESRDGISRIAVVLRGGGKWNDIYTRDQGLVAKKEKIVVVMVAVGIKNFESLSSLQALASEDGTFFVLSKYSDLRMLAASLSKGSCKPISLKVSPENSQQPETTSKPSNNHEACIQESATSFKRHIPGFGYTRETCKDGQTLQKQSCSCQ